MGAGSLISTSIEGATGVPFCVDANAGVGSVVGAGEGSAAVTAGFGEDSAIFP